MQFSKFLIASVTALSLSLTLNPAHAGDSFVSIEQYGADNEFGGSQHGHRHRLTIYQNGYGNSSINSQEGGYNKGVVGQDAMTTSSTATSAVDTTLSVSLSLVQATRRSLPRMGMATPSA